jgi:predicted dehydrogenase
MILRTIHVGVGGHGQWTSDVLGKDPKFKPVALVDTNAAALRVAQYRLNEMGHKSVPGFSGLTGALSQIEADALIICTPTKTHAEYARMGFAVNMHVLVEKPMTIDGAEAKALVAEADAAWVKFCVAQNYRYTAVEQTISYILAHPDHPHYPGEIRIADYVHHRYRPEPRNLDYPFAMVWDMSCHHMDSLSRWLGKAKQVTARSYAAPWTQYVHDANVSAFIEYESGAICNYVLTHDATMYQWRIALQGERGALVLTNHDKLRFYGKPGQQLASAEAESLDCEVMDCPVPEACIADDFFKYVVEDVEPGISGRRNLRTMAMCEALVRSAKNKRPVELAELKK